MDRRQQLQAGGLRAGELAGGAHDQSWLQPRLFPANNLCVSVQQTCIAARSTSFTMPEANSSSMKADCWRRMAMAALHGSGDAKGRVGAGSWRADCWRRMAMAALHGVIIRPRE